jgi:thiol-disulfide isomerase/thioredoxin
MTARKGRSKARRTARGHRQSSTGQILPPIDVRSKGMIGEMMKRLDKGLVIFLFYMDGCSHCHDFMPHFDKAAKNPNRSVQAIKVNESMLPDVQEAIKRKNKNAKDFNITGFPSLLIVGPDGNKITDLDHVNDTKVMTDVMNNAALMANEAGVTQNALTNVEMEAPVELNTSIGSNSARPSVKANFVANNSLGESKGVSITKASMNAVATSNKRINNAPNVTNNVITEQDAEQQASLLSPAMPPTNASLANDKESQPALSGTKGGSLYSAMSQSAYTLAAPAALLATAALMMKHTRKRTRKQKRSRSRSKRV